MRKASKLLKFGNFVGDLLILQILFLFYALKGGVILGILPSFLAVIKCLTSIFYKDNPDELKYEFKMTYREEFRKVNKILWPVLILLMLLIYDLDINKEVIGNEPLAFVLRVLILFVIILLTHLPITILRFDLTYKDYFKQAMLIALSSPFELISIILSFLLIEYVFSRIAIIPLLLGIPIAAMPLAWFSYNSVEKIIKKREGEA